MEVEAALLLISGSIIFIIILVQLTKTGSWQLKKLSSAIKQSPGSLPPTARAKLQNQIYALIHKEMRKEDPKILYQALDVLKIYFGEGLGGQDDPARITKIISNAMRSNKIDVLGYTIHAFYPFIKKAPAEYVPAAIEQLGLIAIVAMKRHKNFLAARAVELIFEGLDRFERIFSKVRDFPQAEADIKSEFVFASAKSLKLIGSSVIRSNDLALFRELCVKINEFICGNNKNSIFIDMWPTIFVAWLNQLARKENEEAFAILLAHINELANNDNNNFDKEALEVLINECRHIIGVSILNPHSSFAIPMLSFLLNSAFRLKDIGIWRQAATCAQEVSQAAVSSHGIQGAFPIIYSLLRFGRKMLIDNLKSVPNGEDNPFSQKAFAVVIKECMKIAEYEARKNFVLTAYDVVLQIRKCWLVYPEAEGSPKYLNKFCQLLIFYWMRSRPKISSQMAYPPAELDSRDLLTENEVKKLGFLF